MADKKEPLIISLMRKLLERGINIRSDLKESDLQGLLTWTVNIGPHREKRRLTKEIPSYLRVADVVQVQPAIQDTSRTFTIRFVSTDRKVVGGGGFMMYESGLDQLTLVKHEDGFLLTRRKST